MSETLTAIRLGYGGYADVDGVKFAMTSGSMDNTVTASSMSMYNMGKTGSRGRVLHADGTVSHSGSLGFDLTLSSLTKLKSLMTRGSSFAVTMCDGEYGMRMQDCLASSISLSGSPSGVLSGSLSFVSDKPPQKRSNSAVSNSRDVFTDGVIPYWWSGQTYARDWNFSFSQSVTPRYGNKNIYNMVGDGILASSPLYIFVGEIEATLDFTTFVPLVTDSVNIANSSFRITGRVASTGYQAAGQSDLGMYKYSITSASLGRSNAPFLFIS
jgi:hypothetical protein